MSVRKTFAKELYRAMSENENIMFIVGDLGYGHFDKIREDFPNRFFNPGAAEQLVLGMAVGMALEGKIPVCYSMTPFILYRPFEIIRTYIDYEKIPVKLIGGGRGEDYGAAGWSHWATDDKDHLSGFNNIVKLWPDEEELENNFDKFLEDPQPYYINVSR
tara:strand:+ start:414 stop:893 length:480 start_codon:yes stop_codon:yes gene_type:complete